MKTEVFKEVIPPALEQTIHDVINCAFISGAVRKISNPLPSRVRKEATRDNGCYTPRPMGGS